jgi:hypothetical protein
MIQLNHCRLCGRTNYDSTERLIKYGPRHYVHGSCAIEEWGARIFDKLPRHSIGKLPIIPLRDAGLLEEARRRYNEHSR